MESKLELGRSGLGRGRGRSDGGGLSGGRASRLDWGGSDLGGDTLRLASPGLHCLYSLHRLDGNWPELTGSAGLGRCCQSEGIMIESRGDRCGAGSGLGLVLTKRLEYEESIRWLIGSWLSCGSGGRGGGCLGCLGSRSRSRSGLWGGGNLGDVEGLEVELDGSSGDGLHCGGGLGLGPGQLRGPGRSGGEGGDGEGGQGRGGGGQAALGSRLVLDVEALASHLLLEARLKCPGVLVEGDGA